MPRTHLNPALTPEHFNEKSKGHFPGLVGARVTSLSEGKMTAELEIRDELFAPNGFVHAGTLVTLADTVAGYGAIAHLPQKAKSFTTLELKSNFLGAAREGWLDCEGVAEHLGRTTQVWAVRITHRETGKKVATFSCTQLVLY